MRPKAEWTIDSEAMSSQTLSEIILPIIKERNDLGHLRRLDLIFYSSVWSKVNSDLWKVFGKRQGLASDSSI